MTPPSSDGARPPADLLFMCVANSARSQLAEALARSLAPPDIAVHSAGSEPATVNPYAIRAMSELGIDLSKHRSKSVSEIPTERIATVITLCDEEVCPAFPGDVRRIHWPFPDPAATRGTDDEIMESFRRVRDGIHARLSEFLSSL